MTAGYINFFDSSDSSVGVIGLLACVFGGIGLAVTGTVVLIQLTASRETRTLSKKEKLIPVVVGLISGMVLILGATGVNDDHPVQDRENAMASNVQKKYGLVLEAVHRCPPPVSLDDCYAEPQPYLMSAPDPETGAYKTHEYLIRWGRSTGEPFIVSETDLSPSVPEVTPHPSEKVTG